MVHEESTITDTIEQWLKNALTTNAWDNHTVVEPLPLVIAEDIEEHLKQHQQRRGRRSYRRQLYRIRISRTNTVTISLIAAEPVPGTIDFIKFDVPIDRA
ncbi:unnamed protein product [Ceratitis capitata]|uniref:(Mediterranean fruit fly) hypothetical protein n=1 Tax=Ceratitis capitata TaxID=7213 RepID=A0A811VCI7_CERCA|nr:unnamed protein product [Ceratitis capitata]